MLFQDATRPWMFAWRPLSAARRRQRKRPFDRKTSHCQRRIKDLRVQGVSDRPLGWTADGRPHQAVTRTTQLAADTASWWNGQQMSAEALKLRWKHDVQIAVLRREAAMTRAVLPNTSAREQWLLSGLVDRTTLPPSLPSPSPFPLSPPSPPPPPPPPPPPLL